MNNKNESRRVKMTKSLLNNSFLDCVAEMPLEKVTVTEICDRADVNRSTYYSYFEDPYDQYQKLEEELGTDIAALLAATLFGEVPGNEKLYKLFTSVLNYIMEKRREFKILLSCNLDLSLLKDIIFSLWDAVFPPEDGADIDDMEQRFRYLYCSSGCISLIFQWVTSDDINTLDADRLARLLVDFTRNNYKLAKTPPPMMDF